MQERPRIAQWLETDDIHPARLDAVFYRRESTENDRAIRHNKYGFKPLAMVARRVFKGAFYVLQGDYRKSGIPFLRTLEIKPGYVTTDQCVYLSPDTHERERKTSVEPRDLVLAKTGGSIGYSAVIPDAIPEANICQDLVGVKLNKGIDAHFLHAFISSRYGYIQAIRWGQGNAHPHLGLDGIREWSIPIPSDGIQSAIGSKIRKAERLQALARNEWSHATQNLEQSLAVSLSPTSFSRFAADDLRAQDYYCMSIAPAVALAGVTDELGAQYFHPRRMNARRMAMRTGLSNSLAETATRVSRRSEQKGAFVGLDAIDSLTGVVNFAAVDSDGSETGCSSFIPKDIQFSRLRPYLNKVAIWPEHQGNGRGSGELLVYRAHKVDPYYLFFVLKSALGLHQVIDVTAGSTHPRVDAAVVDQIRIPRLDEEEEVRIGAMVKKAHDYWYEAQQLGPAAREDVEAVIAGKLGESQLLKEGQEILAWLKANPFPEERGSIE